MSILDIPIFFKKTKSMFQSGIPQKSFKWKSKIEVAQWHHVTKTLWKLAAGNTKYIWMEIQNRCKWYHLIKNECKFHWIPFSGIGGVADWKINFPWSLTDKVHVLYQGTQEVIHMEMWNRKCTKISCDEEYN